MKTSIFEIFKVGIGPSSSHTVGPMKAAKTFLLELEEAGLLASSVSICTELFGSLALTGRGHGTDRAILLGLEGHSPDTVDPDALDAMLERIRTTGKLNLLGSHVIAFTQSDNLVWQPRKKLPGHTNGMRFTATNSAGATLLQQIYYSVGGGFIRRDGELDSDRVIHKVPHPFTSAAELLSGAEAAQLPIWKLMLENEASIHGENAVVAFVANIWKAMKDCIERGLQTEGTLPGGLGVKRRAPRLNKRLLDRREADPLSELDWLNVYAMAVNEENAAGGRVVTAPTNGAAGLLPAVLRYYERFISSANQEGVLKFILTAGAIGILYKENASISGAEVGCQGEVGVACSMAAAGLVAALGGSNSEVEHAAEIGMEHHLGMTCDPIGGLVQIPCIERNAIGAVKAVNACRLAMQDGETHKVSLDQVIKTMFETGRDMKARYKETSRGGLAVNVIEC